MEQFSPAEIAGKCIVIIPAYQPSESLLTLAAALSGSGYRILVVDDGSDASCEGIWSALPSSVLLLHHPENLGKGAALKTTYQYIRDSLPEAQCMITMDADGQHLQADMENVACRALTSPGALVLGSREFRKDVPLRSRFGNKLTRFVFACVSKTKVKDTQTGLRAFDRSLLDYMLQISGERYEYEMNVLLHCREYGIPILEVPIQTVYLDKENSSSHFDSVRDSLRIYRNILKFGASSLISFCADYLLFLLLNWLLPAGAAFLVLSNVLARIGSASLNYTLNTKAVFQDKRPVADTLPRYALLALGILVANSLLLTFFANVAGLPASIAKLITEITLFIISFTVQAKLIYRPSKES